MNEGKRKIGMFEEINVQNGPQEETLRVMVVRTYILEEIKKLASKWINI